MGRAVRDEEAGGGGSPLEPEGAAGLAGADAFATFYDDALPQVYGFFVARCGGDWGAAEELTQETFVAAVGAIRAGREIEAPLPWLFGIARHKLLDHYRRAARAAVDPIPWDARQATGDEPDAAVFGAAPWAEDGWRERTLAALVALPVAQRHALVLRHLDEMTVPAVAAALARSVHATESLLPRGRAGFKWASNTWAEAGDGDG